MTLEQASYIFGIPASLATIVGFYFVWHSHVRERASHTQNLHASRKEVTPTETGNALPTDIAQEADLLEAFKAAKEIFHLSERDEALGALVDSAIRRANFVMAMRIVEPIFHHSAKDAALARIVEGAIKTKQWSVATQASDKIVHISAKASAKQCIINAAK